LCPPDGTHLIPEVEGVSESQFGVVWKLWAVAKGRGSAENASLGTAVKKYQKKGYLVSTAPFR